VKNPIKTKSELLRKIRGFSFAFLLVLDATSNATAPH